MSQWVCLTVSSAFHHGDKDAVASEMQRIFGEDLKEARIVSDDFMEQSGEFFTLICCTDYSSHIDALKDSAAVIRTVPSYEEPAFLSKEEVDSFAQSVDEEPPPEELVYGDMVRIAGDVKPSTLQHLSGLYGLVIGFGKRPGWVIVYFRFETRSFENVICSTSLEFLGNVFENMRIPPFKSRVKRSSLFRRHLKNRAAKAVGNLVSRDKICRKQRRELERPYNRR